MLVSGPSLHMSLVSICMSSIVPGVYRKNFSHVGLTSLSLLVPSIGTICPILSIMIDALSIILLSFLFLKHETYLLCLGKE